jgi:hypothetical protein
LVLAFILYSFFEKKKKWKKTKKKLTNRSLQYILKNQILYSMDVLVFGTMKNAAKCDNNCELQNKRNNHDFERKWREIGVDLFSTKIKWEKKKTIPKKRKTKIFFSFRQFDFINVEETSPFWGGWFRCWRLRKFNNFCFF